MWCSCGSGVTFGTITKFHQIFLGYSLSLSSLLHLQQVFSMTGTDMKASISDADRLAQLGYKQELNRSINWFSNFGATFSIVSVPTATFPLLAYGILSGGKDLFV